MQGIEVGIDEILNCREKRVAIQNEMIKKFWEELDILGINHLRDEKDEIEVNKGKMKK